MSGPADWIVAHPRLGAGLWFGSFLTLGSLAFLLLVEAIAFTLIHRLQVVRPVQVATLGACFLTAMCMGSVFGSRLIRSAPFPAASDGYRVGAFVGLCSGLLSGVLGMLMNSWSLWRSAEPGDAFSRIVVILPLAFLTSVTYLPFGVLAGWSLVRVVSSRRARPVKGGHR